MAYNPGHQQPLQHSVSYQSQYGVPPPHSQPANPQYNPSVPRDIPHRGSYGQAKAPGQYYGTTPPQSYGTTPPMQYGTTPPGQYSTGQMYGTSPSQRPQMYGTTPPQQQYLSPFPSQPGYPSQPQPGYAAPQAAHGAPPHGRPRGNSTSSHHSHKSHHSSYSKTSRYDEKSGRRKNSRVESPRPSFGDTMSLMWSSLKGAFDGRK